MEGPFASPFLEALHSDGPLPQRADRMGLYAFLIGSWTTELTAFAADGTRHESRGEIHAGWVLEGRAIQDVWITPSRAERGAGGSLPVIGSWYGTTLRAYDPKLDAWHILWSDPATGFYSRQIGRARGADIEQTGTAAPGLAVRWSFTEIRPDSFLWRGEESRGEGASWRLLVEVRARRVARP